MSPIDTHLLNKYNVPIPRYTSYPTVPYWDNQIDANQWKSAFSMRFEECNENQGISLYIHLPFCESMCTFCGCNKRITTNHKVEDEYIDVVLKEWQLYRQQMTSTPLIREFHLGGGTPTFFSPENLHRLIQSILSDSQVAKEHEFSFEGHPNNTTYAHLKTLFDLGFNRVSFGMQDSNPEVQQVINRIQPQENVQQVVQWAREIGYESVNIDLVYGLPLQTIDRIEKTIQDAISLRPDRIAFYSYAHVPWTSRGQRLFDENDLPTASEKLTLYQLGRSLFLAQGYQDIGMDHFALPDDLMYKIKEQGTLHRNFMGYTVQQTGMVLGLGVSSISDVFYGFAQNKKTIHDYYEEIKQGKLAIFKGYFLTETDQAMRQYILDVACNGKTQFRPEDLPMLETYTFPYLAELEEDGLIQWDFQGLTLTSMGANFVRNVCKAFDLKLLSDEHATLKFSQAV